MIKNEYEIWKSLPGFPVVEVSTLGRVRTLDRVVPCRGNRTRFLKGHVLKQCDDKNGYLQTRIKVDGKWITKRVHRLVAQTFIPNPKNLPQVNHKDCNRANNNVSNLEWVTNQENAAYRDKLGRTARNNAPKSPVYAVNLKTLEVSRFQSRIEAGRELGVFYQCISKVIQGKRKQTGGFWFVNDDNNAADTIKQKLQDIGGTGLKIYN